MLQCEEGNSVWAGGGKQKEVGGNSEKSCKS